MIAKAIFVLKLKGQRLFDFIYISCFVPLIRLFLIIET